MMFLGEEAGVKFEAVIGWKSPRGGGRLALSWCFIGRIWPYDSSEAGLTINH